MNKTKMSILFPDDLWREIKSYVLPTNYIHPYIKYQELMDSGLLTYGYNQKKQRVRDMSNMIDNINNNYNKDLTRRSKFIDIIDPQNKAYKSVTLYDLDEIFINELNTIMEQCLCVQEKKSGYGALVYIKLGFKPQKITLIPADKLALAKKIFKYAMGHTFLGIKERDEWSEYKYDKRYPHKKCV
jgi:hypothetical protein